MEAPIYARTSGYLKTWYTDIGARVHKGQLLAEIETPEVDRQLAQARADLDTARRQLAPGAEPPTCAGRAWRRSRPCPSKMPTRKPAMPPRSVATEASARQNVATAAGPGSPSSACVAPFDGVVTARNTDVGALINAGRVQRCRAVHEWRTSITCACMPRCPKPYAAATRTGLQCGTALRANIRAKRSRHRRCAPSNALDPDLAHTAGRTAAGQRERRVVSGRLCRDPLQAAERPQDPAGAFQHHAVPRQWPAGRDSRCVEHHQTQDHRPGTRFRQDHRDPGRARPPRTVSWSIRRIRSRTG